ncbi:MAG: hypothetical protein BGO78_04785 [Chloroflexi bacterium 44-23]|nr:MAG: hypothetical protein BGO78_04785 [Chloroflexi bacterium 44-23]
MSIGKEFHGKFLENYFIVPDQNRITSIKKIISNAYVIVPQFSVYLFSIFITIFFIFNFLLTFVFRPLIIYLN